MRIKFNQIEKIIRELELILDENNFNIIFKSNNLS